MRELLFFCSKLVHIEPSYFYRLVLRDLRVLDLDFDLDLRVLRDLRDLRRLVRLRRLPPMALAGLLPASPSRGFVSVPEKAAAAPERASNIPEAGAATDST